MLAERLACLWAALFSGFVTWAAFAAYRNPNANAITRFLMWLAERPISPWSATPKTNLLIFIAISVLLTLMELVLAVRP
jgi:hypothetical protein